jgi:hypothetical protein
VSRFSDRDGVAVAKFRRSEAEIIAGLARQVASVVATREDVAGDPLLDRLFPDAYRDSPEDSAEFRRFTDADLGDEKIRNALALASSLEPQPDSKRVRVELDDTAALAWLRALNDIRLSLGVRLAIDDDGRPTATGEGIRFLTVVYAWLGDVQYSLVSAIDR